MTNTSANNDNGIYRVGDIVVGSSDPGKSVYSASGTRIIDDGVSLYGSDKALSAQGKELVNSAIRSGGVPVSVAKSNKSLTVKKTTKKKTVVKQPEQFSAADYLAQFDVADAAERPSFVTPVTAVEKTIQFENSFGRMKAKVEYMLEQELAYMLVFKDEDSVVFEPKVGEILTLHTPDKEQVPVYYPGVMFDAPEGSRKMMILFKVPSEE
jgi:hypothetical protein